MSSKTCCYFIFFISLIVVNVTMWHCTSGAAILAEILFFFQHINQRSRFCFSIDFS